MYKAFFGFREKPFKLVPNPDFLFLSKSHEIALAHLTYATEHGEGFVVITGEVGTGKTTLCRNFLEELDEHTESAYIFNPHLESDQLLDAICNEFGITSRQTGTKAVLDSLYDYLIKKNASGRKVILLIDEAQSLSTQNLELVRMLSNLETTRSKLLQIILVGQPELDDKLESHELRQLAQRISLSCHLVPLSVKDTQAYIQHRLRIAAQRQADLFAPDACRLAYRFSRGIPRLINIICDRALLTAYIHNRPKVTKRVMHTAIMEITSRGKENVSYKRWPLFLGAGVCGLAVAFALMVLFMRTDIRYKLIADGPETTGRLEGAQDPAKMKSFKIQPLDETRRGAAQTVKEFSEADNPGIAPRTRSNEDQQSGSPDMGSSVSFFPVPNPGIGTDQKMKKAGIDQLIGRLDSISSRKKAVIRLLSIWHQPHPNADLIPGEMEDSGFFDIVARQYGLRIFSAQNDWNLVQRLNLPAILSLKNSALSQPVYLTLVGWRDRTLYLHDGQKNRTFESDFDTLQPYLDGQIYIFWKNGFGYDMIIGNGADPKAVSVVKTLLRQIGYERIPHTPEFDSSTRAAVRDFQARHNLHSDGLVGPLTKIMLLRVSGTFDMPTLLGQEGPHS